MDTQKKVLQVLILQYLTEKFSSSPSRARTYDLAVNSRSLYQLSYRGLVLRARILPCLVKGFILPFFLNLSRPCY